MNGYFKLTHEKKEVNFNELLSCCHTNTSNFSQLVRLMRKHVVIPFIGAGISRNFGYSGWDNFICHQADEQNMPEVKSVLQNREYEKAASLLKQKLTVNVWENILLQEFGDHIYKASGFNNELELIPKLFRSLILTTNFDEVIEMLYAKVNGEYIEKLTPKSLKDSRVIYKRIACGEPTLIKLHGDVATREFILTEREYNETYGENIIDIRLPLPAFLRDILLSKVILFIGCSLKDDRTLKVIEQAQTDGSMSFALLPLPENTENKNNPWVPELFNIVDNKRIEKESFAERKQFLYQHNIIPIWYPYGMGEICVKLFLKELVYEVDSEFKMSVTNVKEEVEQLLYQGENKKKCNKVLQAYQLYTQAEKLIKTNLYIYSKEEQIRYLQSIKDFYNAYGYGYERREIFKDLITLIKQSNHGYGIELAMCYHDIGYMFEKYHYYELMLKAMRHSSNILENSKGHFVKENLNLWFDNAAFIYTSLGYAYLKNHNDEQAKYWYQRAIELMDNHDLCKRSRAFINNGIYRYYSLLGDIDKTLECLDLALEQRKSLIYGEGRDIPQHIINTHSNKIRIYLYKKNDIEKAEREYDLCMKEDDIWNRLREFPDAKRRILTDHGDILNAIGDYNAAFEEYKKALSHRKYLHYIDDITAAELYLKMSNSLKELPDRIEEALEYIIQSYVIFQKILSEDNYELKIIEQQMYALNKKMDYKESVLKQRFTVQGFFLDYRYDEQMKEREEELIRYFELE